MNSISSHCILSIRHHFIDETDISNESIPCPLSLDQDTVFVTMSRVSVDQMSVEYYAELIKSCVSCHVLDNVNVLFVFIGQVHRRSDFMNLRQEIVRCLPPDIVKSVSTAFVNDKAAIISHKLNAVTSSWWGMMPSIISSVHVLLAGGQKIFPLTPRIDQKNNNNRMTHTDVSTSIINAQIELEQSHWKWLNVAREHFISIEESIFFGNQNQALLESSMFPLIMPYDALHEILSYSCNCDIYSFSVTSRGSSKLMKQFHLKKLSQYLDRFEYVLSHMGASGMHQNNYNNLDLRDVSAFPFSPALSQAYSIETKLNSFGSQSLVPSSISDVSEEVTHESIAHRLIDFGCIRLTYPCQLPDNSLGFLRCKLTTLKNKTDKLLDVFKLI